MHETKTKQKGENRSFVIKTAQNVTNSTAVCRVMHLKETEK